MTRIVDYTLGFGIILFHLVLLTFERKLEWER
jgi:hypothetical protein